MAHQKPGIEATLPPRRSSSASESRKAEMERIERMTIEERIHAALTMSRRFSWLQPTPRPR